MEYSSVIQKKKKKKGDTRLINAITYVNAKTWALSLQEHIPRKGQARHSKKAAHVQPKKKQALATNRIYQVLDLGLNGL